MKTYGEITELVDLKLRLPSAGQLTLAGTDSASSFTATFPAATGTVALLSNNLGAFASTTSAQLASVLSDETGTGAAVFATSPTLVTPALGTPSSATLTNATGLPIGAGTTGTLGADRGGTGVANNAASTLTISGAFATTLTVSNTTSLTLPTSGTLATLGGTQTFSGNLTFTGSHTVTAGNVAMKDQTDPTKQLFFDASALATGTSATLKLAGNLTTAGNNSLTLTTTGSTSVTLPTSGTLTKNDLSNLAGTTAVNSPILPATDNTLNNGSYSASKMWASMDTYYLTLASDSATKYVNLNKTAGGTSYSLSLPNAQGAASTTLSNDGSGNLTWVALLSNPMTTAGDIIKGGSSGTPTRLAIGSEGQQLHVASSIPAWAWQEKTTAASSNYTASNFNTDGTSTLLVTTGSSTITVTLPDASTQSGRRLTIKKVDSGSGKVTIATTSSQTVDGWTTTDMGVGVKGQYAWIQVTSDGANWAVTGTGGDYQEMSQSSMQTLTGIVSGQYIDVPSTSLTLPPGTWLISGRFNSRVTAGSVTDVLGALSKNANNTTTDQVVEKNQIEVSSLPVSGGIDSGGIFVTFRDSFTASATYRLKVNAAFSSATVQGRGFWSATRTT